jgi:hypothetical protein
MIRTRDILASDRRGRRSVRRLPLRRFEWLRRAGQDQASSKELELKACGPKEKE